MPPGARPRQAHRPARRPPHRTGIPQDPHPHRHRPADHRSQPRPRRPGQALHPDQPAHRRTRASPGDRPEAQARNRIAAPGRGLGSQDAPEPGRPRLAGCRSDARRRGHGRDDARLLGRRAHPSRAAAGARPGCTPRLSREQPVGSTPSGRTTRTKATITARPGSPPRAVESGRTGMSPTSGARLSTESVPTCESGPLAGYLGYAGREVGVVSLRFGLADGLPKTLDEIGKVYGVTGEAGPPDRVQDHVQAPPPVPLPGPPRLSRL